MKRFLVLVAISAVFLMGAPLFTQPGFCLRQKIPLKRMVKNSDVIVIGYVVNKQSKQEPKIGINTYITIKVEQTLKGLPQEKVLLRVQGGVVDGIALYVSPTPKFQKDEQVLLFLLKKKGQEPYIVSGWLKIKNGIILRNNKPLEEIVGEIQDILGRIEN